MENTKKILEFIHYAEGLKDVLRHNWTSKDRHESSAEHSWRLALMAIMLAPKLDKKNSVDLEKVIKMVIVHDFVEIEAGDTPAQKVFFSKKLKDKKVEEEQYSMAAIKKIAGAVLGEELEQLWLEYIAMETNESKFAKALDKLEVRIQHNESLAKRIDDDEKPRAFFAADKFVEYDSFLKKLFDLIKEESKQKFSTAGWDVKKILAEAERLKLEHK